MEKEVRKREKRCVCPICGKGLYTKSTYNTGYDGVIIRYKKCSGCGNRIKTMETEVKDNDPVKNQ